ncbi:hypothetical protein HDU91_007291 [Kappamyces sp. JEL0680]|nr:hypothetical protein HDU91_007291 [Kappamyces sp. JEL0680]
MNGVWNLIAKGQFQNAEISLNRMLDSASAKDLRTHLDVNALHEALQLSRDARNSAAVLNISIAFIEIGRNYIQTYPELFLSVGRELSHLLQSQWCDVSLDWKILFHMTQAYVELLTLSSARSLEEELLKAGKLAQKHKLGRSNYMQALSVIVAKSQAAGTKLRFSEEPCFQIFSNFVSQNHNHTLLDSHLGCQPSGCQLYIDLEWIALEFTKHAIQAEQLAAAHRLLAKLELSAIPEYELRRIFYKELCLLKASEDKAMIWMSLDNLASIVAKGSMGGSRRLVLDLATMFWNVSYPLFQDENHPELVRTLEKLLVSLGRVGIHEGSLVANLCHECQKNDEELHTTGRVMLAQV